MNPKRQQFDNVRVLPNMGVGSDNRAYNTSLSDKGLGNVKVDTKATRWEGNNLTEATAVAHAFPDNRAEATGSTPNEARQKAYNAASTKKVERAKSGETAKKEAERVTSNDVTPKKTIRIRSN